MSARRLPHGRLPAEAFPPGDFIADELAARGWTPEMLADALSWQRTMLDAVLTGERELTPEMARDLADGFGTSAHFWLAVETSYRRWLSRQPASQEGES